MRVGVDAREAFRHNPRGIGLYARHLMREFAELCPDNEFLLYHERDEPPDMPPIPPNMRGVRTEVRGSPLAHMGARRDAVALATRRTRHLPRHLQHVAPSLATVARTTDGGLSP